MFKFKLLIYVNLLRANRLTWYGHVKRRAESSVTRISVLDMNVDGYT